MAGLKLYPYVIGSESAKKLANLLGILQVKPDGNYIPKFGDKVVGWGASRSPDWAVKAMNRGVTILNKPTAVNIAANKLSTFEHLFGVAGIRIPEFTKNIDRAKYWLQAGHTVVERHELRGNSGAGIRIVNLDDADMEKTIQYAPLYTRFIPKTAEFRVHCFRGEVIDYIEKKKLNVDRRPANFNKYISSMECGWVFSRTDVRDIPEVRTMALKAVAALGLDFGAVDVAFCDGVPYILEVNCSPGLAGTTLIKYGNAIRKFMGQPDLPASVTASILDQPIQHVVAANTASVDNAMHEMINLRLDRATALKLKSLLAHI